MFQSRYAPFVLLAMLVGCAAELDDEGLAGSGAAASVSASEAEASLSAASELSHAAIDSLPPAFAVEGVVFPEGVDVIPDGYEVAEYTLPSLPVELQRELDSQRIAQAAKVDALELEYTQEVEARGLGWNMPQTWWKGAGANNVYQANDNTIKIPATGTTNTMCVLQGLGGDFSNYPDDIVSMDDGRGELRAVGTGPQMAQARCFMLDQFYAHGPDRWKSQPTVLKAISGLLGGGDESPSRAVWWGDSTTFIQGLQGDFNGDEEALLVLQNTYHSASSVVNVYTDAWVTAGLFQSFFVGDHLLRRSAGFYNANATFWGLTFVTEDTVSAGPTSYGEKVLAKSFYSMCHLTSVGGDFDSGEDRVEIVERTINGARYWVLVVRGSSINSAGARCFKRFQFDGF